MKSVIYWGAKIQSKSSYNGKYFDGVHLSPAKGRVELSGGSILFIDEDNETHTFRLDRIQSVNRVKSELHIEIGQSIANSPSVKIVSDDPAFDEVLAKEQSRYGISSIDSVLRGLQRMPTWVWLGVGIIMIPLMYVVLSYGPVLGHVLISTDKEQALGDFVFRKIAGGYEVCDDAELTRQIESMVADLRDPESPYHHQLTVFVSDEANAFALPGGRIFIFTGLLKKCESPNALAGILAHEIAHVEQRHGLKQMLRAMGTMFFMSSVIGGGLEKLEIAETISELSGLLIVLSYSREHEREADRLAVEKMHRNKHSVAGMIQFFRSMAKEGDLSSFGTATAYLSSHPLTTERIRMLEERQQSEHFRETRWLPSDSDWKSYQDACTN